MGSGTSPPAGSRTASPSRRPPDVNSQRRSASTSRGLRTCIRYSATQPSSAGTHVHLAWSRRPCTTSRRKRRPGGSRCSTSSTPRRDGCRSRRQPRSFSGKTRAPRSALSFRRSGETGRSHSRSALAVAYSGCRKSGRTGLDAKGVRREIRSAGEPAPVPEGSPYRGVWEVCANLYPAAAGLMGQFVNGTDELLAQARSRRDA